MGRATAASQRLPTSRRPGTGGNPPRPASGCSKRRGTSNSEHRKENTGKQVVREGREGTRRGNTAADCICGARPCPKDRPQRLGRSDRVGIARRAAAWKAALRASSRSHPSMFGVGCWVFPFGSTSFVSRLCDPRAKLSCPSWMEHLLAGRGRPAYVSERIRWRVRRRAFGSGRSVPARRLAGRRRPAKQIKFVAAVVSPRHFPANQRGVVSASTMSECLQT